MDSGLVVGGEVGIPRSVSPFANAAAIAAFIDLMGGGVVLLLLEALGVVVLLSLVGVSEVEEVVGVREVDVVALVVGLPVVVVVLVVVVFSKNFAVDLPWCSSKWSRAQVFRCLSVSTDVPVSPLGLVLCLTLLLLFWFGLAPAGLKRFAWACLKFSLSVSVIGFGAGVLGVGRNLSFVLGALSFHFILTSAVAVPNFLAQICFHFCGSLPV